MTRNFSLAAIAAVITLASGHAASAQVLYYDHHSTALGDWYGGAAEVLHGQAAYMKAEAEAAETWVKAEAAHDDLEYQRAEHRFQSKQMQLEYNNRRREDKLARQAVLIASRENDAVRLHKTAQLGAVSWPSALMRPEFAASMSMIESVLRNWSPSEPNGEVYRRALATEAGVLRNKIANNKSLPYNSRHEAVLTLKKLQMLAGVSVESSGNGQLASAY